MTVDSVDASLTRIVDGKTAYFREIIVLVNYVNDIYMKNNFL